MKYKVDFSYNIPEFGEIELDVENEDLARLEAQTWIETTFPEALDIEIDGVTIVS